MKISSDARSIQKRKITLRSGNYGDQGKSGNVKPKSIGLTRKEHRDSLHARLFSHGGSKKEGGAAYLGRD